DEILAPYGCEMTWEIKAGLMGKNDQASTAHLFSALPSIALSPEDFLSQRRALQAQRWPHVKLLPGATKLIAHLHAHGIPMAVATGSSRAPFVLKTAHLPETFGLFGDNVVCADDARMLGRKSKPAPDVFLQAAQLLDRSEYDGSKGLVFEDGIPTSRPLVADPQLQQVAGADTSLVVPPETRPMASLEDFAPEEYGLPPYST
ncbi:hypothetical protein EXIGLDRAFT_603765, partial [Exidia glandulosa HHB12029]